MFITHLVLSDKKCKSKLPRDLLGVERYKEDILKELMTNYENSHLVRKFLACDSQARLEVELPMSLLRLQEFDYIHVYISEKPSKAELSKLKSAISKPNVPT